MSQKMSYWVVVVAFLIASCTRQDFPVAPQIDNNVGETINNPNQDVLLGADSSQSRGLQATAALATYGDPLKWPTSIRDFVFPTAFGQAWTITCGYGCGLHVNYGNYPAAGYYAVDLVRKYQQTIWSCVTAPARGVVIFADWMSGYGWTVIMDHDYGHTGQGYRSIVAHLETDPRQYIRVGDDLRAGTVLGYCGDSGGKYVPHIHFSVWKNFRSVPLTGISGYNSIVVGGIYYSGCWPVQPPRGTCTCP